MQSQMIGMQSSLDRILSAIQTPQSASVAFNGGSQPASMNPPQQGNYSPQAPVDLAGFSNSPLSTLATGTSGSSFYPMQSPREERSKSKFPPLPGFAPPPHKFATYGIVPSTAPSSDDESEETLPRASMNAPLEALQGLANAAAEAASTPLSQRYVD